MYETDVFISYKREEIAFAFELRRRLENKTLTVWIDQNIPYGRDWRKEIDKHLNDAFLVIVITEPNAMKSAYVTYEWSYACLTLRKDFHWIEIESCDYNDGMFGLLASKRQNPIKANRTPTDDEWDHIIKSVTDRLDGLKQIREAGRIITSTSVGGQKEAAEYLGQVNDEFHVPFARQLLLKGLKAHTRTSGASSGPIVTALTKLGGDLSSLPYLINFLDAEHEVEIDNDARALIRKIAGQYG